LIWGACLAGVLLVLLILFILELAKGAERALPPPADQPSVVPTAQ
jgi:hypothetical protein